MRMRMRVAARVEASPIEFKKFPRRQGDQSNSFFESVFSLFSHIFFPTRSLSMYQERLNTVMPASVSSRHSPVSPVFFPPLSSPFHASHPTASCHAHGKRRK